MLERPREVHLLNRGRSPLHPHPAKVQRNDANHLIALPFLPRVGARRLALQAVMFLPLMHLLRILI